MGFLDRLLGRTPQTEQNQQRVGWGDARNPRSAATPPRPRASEDERALARYRYLLRTAPPEQLEALHAEAFAKLTPEQRQQLLRELSNASPVEAGTSAEPADLARAATRAEMRQPGTLQNAFSRGSAGAGMGMGGMFAGSMMGTIAGVVVGSAVANMLFDGYDTSPEAQEAGDTGGDPGTDSGDGGTDAGGDAGDAGSGDAGFASDTSNTDAGGDWGSGGGDWGGGGGDFGGGDFGGGDFGGF
ncbi:MAG: hypothetical protein ACJ711_07405 [Ornithinibacter sp.]